MAVIPARWASTRLPGKVLETIGDAPMIEHVWRRACAARSVDAVIVATDDERVHDVARGFGAEVRMTAAHHPSGTDRVHEAVQDSDAEIVVNVQGDEPLIAPETIDAVVATLGEGGEGFGVGTLAFEIRDPAELADPNLVKVAVAPDGRALYFSRAPIPYDRTRKGSLGPHHRGHIGLYAFRRDALERFVRLEPGRLEHVEGLEQLRFLENGIGIRVATTEHRSFGVDTPEDLVRARMLVEGDVEPVGGGEA